MAVFTQMFDMFVIISFKNHTNDKQAISTLGKSGCTVIY